MISTSNVSALPRSRELQQICKAVSVLDAIICPEWEYRYFSYQAKWSETEEFCEIRNGQGDHMLILFHRDGCVINGMVHEFLPKDKLKLTKGLPEAFHEFLFGEPVSSIGTTFCLWTTDNNSWHTGEINNLNDGSFEMLWIFDNNPQTYLDWATEYYEGDFVMTDETKKTVSDIYAGTTLTREMVLSIKKDPGSWSQLEADLKEIGYPYQV